MYLLNANHICSIYILNLLYCTFRPLPVVSDPLIFHWQYFSYFSPIKENRYCLNWNHKITHNNLISGFFFPFFFLSKCFYLYTRTSPTLSSFAVLINIYVYRIYLGYVVSVLTSTHNKLSLVVSSSRFCD